MKLIDIKTQVQTSSDFQSQQFAIGDVSIILEILRSKIYSNPIHIVCQEIMSNARDAHREVGKDSVPIRITIPNALDTNLTIRDFGPGITPDRMANIFIQYGKSTKRSDNKQTGGFGLGAKTPFSYSDSFAIETITPHDGIKIKRQYVAYIDESRVGTMSLITQEETTEECGTAIIITPKQFDTNKFVEAITKVAKYWTVKPEIINRIITWPSRNILFSSLNWEITSNEYYEEQHSAIVDGILYPLNIREIEIPKEYETINTVSFSLFFKTGEMKVTASRESIDYQPEIKLLIKNKIVAMCNELKKIIENKIAHATSLWEAGVLFSTINLRFIPECAWNGLKIKKSLEINAKRAKIFRCTTDDGGVLTISQHEKYDSNQPIRYSNDALLIEDDTGAQRPSRARIMTLCELHPNKNLYVVIFIKDAAGSIASNKQHVEDAISWSKLSPIKLSTIEPKKLPRTSKAYTICVMRKFVENKSTGTTTWDPVDDDTIENGSGVYVIKSNGKFKVFGKLFDTNSLTYHLAGLGIEIFSVLEKKEGEVGPGWTHIDKYVVDKINELNNDKDITEFSGELHSAYSMTRNHNALWNFATKHNIIDKIKHEGIFNQYFNRTKKVEEVTTKIQFLKNCYQVSGLKDTSSTLTGKSILKTLSEEFDERYPLIGSLSYDIAYSHNHKAIMTDMVEYINKKDGEANADKLHQNVTIDNTNPQEREASSCPV